MKHGAQLRQFFIDRRFQAGILQADGVDHALRAFRDAGRRIAETRLEGRAFERKRAETIDIVVFGEFIAVTEGAGGGDQRVFKIDAAEVHAQSSHRISSFRSTGPSLQMRL